jgi:hypothetical protein
MGGMLEVTEPYPGESGEVSAAARWRWLSGTLVVVPLVVVSVMVVTRPEKRTVTPLYHEAVARWAAGKGLYDGPAGMNYLPTFVAVFAPFHLLPRVMGDLLWRWMGWLGLAFGMWRWTRQEARPQRAFALAALVGLPLCLGALRNGQANGPLGAALLLAAVCLAEGRSWAAVLLVCLSAAIKPLGLAAAGLLFAAYPRLWWRLGIGLAGTMLLPFLCGPGDYVRSQYVAEWANLRQCAAVTDNRFADVNGLLRAAHAPLSGSAALLVRGGAGLAMAVFCYLVARSLPERERALGWLAFAAGYLVLFNPMSEANSYVALAPALALWSRWLFVAARPAGGWLVAGAAGSMGLLPTLLRPWLGDSFALAWFPLMAIVFLCVVTEERLTQAARP